MPDRSPSPATHLPRFFLLTFALTWTAWIWAGSAPGGLAAPGPLRTFVLYVGIFAPALVAIALTALGTGRDGLRALLRPLFRGSVGLRWYLFAVGYMAAIKLTAALILRLATGVWPRFGADAWYIMLAATLFSTVVGGQSGEEIGWRGFGLPRLAARMGLARASLLLGVIWAGWHLPLFFIPGTDTTGQSFPQYLLMVTAISVIIAWLWQRTGGSLLLTMLMHAAINNTKDIVPSAVPGAANPFGLSTSPVAWISLALLWITAAYLLVLMSGPSLPSSENPMRGLQSASLVVVVVTLLGVGVTPARGQATPNAAAEDSVRALEEARGQALMHGDTVALSRMTAVEFNELTRLGTIRTRAANIWDVASGMLRLLTVRYDSLTVRMYGDVAILQGIADNTGTMGGVPFSGRIRYTRVFVWRDGRWQAITMQHTPMP